MRSRRDSPTLEDVQDALIRLEKEGIKPSLRQVTKIVGGSFSTVAHLLRDLRTRKFTSQLDPSTGTVEAILLDSLRKAYTALLDESVDAALLVMERSKREAEEEAEKVFAAVNEDVNRLENDLREARARSAQLEDELKQCHRQISDLKSALKK